MRLGEALLAYRRRNGITQQELARRAGVSIRTLRDIEQGAVTRPRAPSLRKLAEAVGVPVESIIVPAADRPADVHRALRVDVLGSLTLWVRGREVDLRPSMQRRLLGLLALQANRVVSQAEIVECLWGEDIPGSYLNLVHTYTSRLRRFFRAAGVVEELIDRVGDGYRIRLTAGESDLLEFADLVAQAAAHLGAGRAEEAERGYEQALALWRGSDLADLGPYTLHHPAAVAASRQRLTAVMEYADLALAHGRPEAALARSQEVAHEEPLHEGLNARILLALAASGQRAAALRSFADMRDRLRDGLGIEPGDELHDAYLRVLRQEAPNGRPGSGPPVRDADAAADTTADATPSHGTAAEAVPDADAVPAQLPPGSVTFTGRDRQIGELDAYLTDGDARPADDARPAAARVVVISGTAGVGKTALAVHWAHHARHRYPDGQLFYNLHGYSDTIAKTAADVLTSFLLGLGVAPAGVPQDVEARISLFRSLTANRRMLLVLDNAADVDDVRPLIPANPHSAVVVTSRNQLSGLQVHDDARIVQLDVLSDAEAAELLTALLGEGVHAAYPDLCGELATLCAHLPLALRIAAANISRGTYGTVADYVKAVREGDRLAELAIDGASSTAVEAAFALSYAALPPSAARLFRLLGLVPGPDFTVAAAAVLSGTTPREARWELARLTAAHLVDRYEPERYRFHDLLRLYAAERAAHEESPQEVTRARRHLYDWYLLGARAAVEWSHPHWARLPLNGTAAGVPATSFDGLAAAARWLSAEHRNMVAAVHEAARTGPRRSAWLLTDTLRSHFWASQTMDDGLSCARTAVVAAREEGDVAGAAAATLTLANAHGSQGWSDVLPLYHEALALADRGAWTAGMSSIRNNVAGHYLALGQLEDAARALREGIELDVADDQTASLGVKHVNLAAVYTQLGRLDAASGHLDHALRLLPDTDGMIGLNIGEVRHLQGRPHDALRYLERAHARCVQAGAQAIEPMALVCLADVHNDLGDHEAALELSRQALARSRELADGLVEPMAHNVLGRLHGRAGRHAEAFGHHRRALELAGDARLYVKTTALIGLADTARALGGEEAGPFAEQALRIARERSFRILEGQARTALAGIALADADPAEAERQARLALAIHRETGHEPGAAHARRTLADLGTPP